MDEDGSVLFTLGTTGVAAGTEYSYTLAGVSASDVTGGALAGTAKIGSDGKAVIQVNLVEDSRTEGTETLTLNVAGQAASVSIIDTSTAPGAIVPTYSLAPIAASVDEGGTATFRLTTTNVASGSQFAYSLSGVSSSDVVGGQLTGLATVGVDGVALVSVNLAADATTEGAETLTLDIANQTASVSVADTSRTQIITEASYVLTGSTNVNEGGTATFTLKTTGIAAGALVGYRISGTGSAASLSTTGTFTVDADGNAIISTPVGNNSTIGDTGVLTVELLNGKSAPVVATVVDTTPTTYSADAITSANAASGVLTINVAGTTAQTLTLDTDQLTPTNGFVINSTSSSVSLTSAGLGDKITLTGNGNNTLNTGNGNDTVLVSGSGNNTVVVGAGNDTVTITGSGTNRVEVGSGNDTVTGGAGADTIVMGSGALTAADLIDGGEGIDTLIVSGDGNDITAANVKSIENLVLNGTQVAFSSDAVLESFGSIQGSSATSELTVTVASNAVVDLSKIDLLGIKSIKLDGTATGVTVVASSADLAAIGAFTRGTNVGAVNLETDVAGYKSYSAANDTAFAGGTLTVTGTAQDLITNKSALVGATLKVSDSTSLADVTALADAGIAATKTVTLSVTELLTAANLPDQLAALTAANTLIQVTGTATVAQAAALNSSYSTQIAAYQAAATGNAGIAISDTPANVAGALTTSGSGLAATGANAATVSSITLTSGSGVAEADAAKLALLASTKVSGSYTVTDSVTHITAAIASSTLPASLSKAASVTLSTGNRTASTTTEALELQIIGSKLVGGYDYTRTNITTLSSDDLTAIAGAANASLAKTSGEFSVTEVNSILAQNSSATVDKIADTAQNLSLNASKLKAATSDIFVNTIATVEQANAFGASVAALAAKQGATVNPGTGQNSYKISDTKAAVLAASAETTVKASDGVTVSDAMSLAEATQLQALTAASPTNGRLNSGELTYTVSDAASALATALSATVNTAMVAALAGATTVTGTGTATVAEATVLGAQYSSAVQVDSYKISDTVANLFTTATGATLSTDIDATTDAALAKATTLSVVGNVTVAQLAALKGVQNNASATIFDNKYAITDSAANVSTAAGNALANLRAATSITVSDAATVAQLAGLKTLNDARTTDATSLASFALKDTISDIVGANALGSGTAAVVAFAKTATSITVTGDATSISLASLDDLATKAGTKAYSVELTDAASAVGALSAGVLGSAAVTKLILSDASLSVANAKSTIANVGAAASKLSYNLVDSVENLLATADASVVTSAVNLRASDTAISAANAAKLVALTGTSGTVTYSLNGTYADLVAQSASIADGATAIDVSNASLTVAQYTELLARAGLTTTVTTTVSAEVISGTAAEVSGASAAVLAHASSVTLTNNASLTLTAAQAKALVAAGNAGYDVTVTPASSTLQVKIVDTTANLIKAKTDSASDNALAYVLAAGSYKVVASDTATLSVADATILNSISDIVATYNLADASGNLVSGGTADAAVAGASSVTVTATSGDATTAAEAKAIYDANKNVSFDVVTSTADILKTQTNSVYDYAATLSKAGKVVLSAADEVADVKAAVAAAGGTPVEYSLSDTPTALAATTAASLVSGAKGLAFSSGTPTALEAVALAPFASKFSGGKFDVTDTAADLVDNLNAVDAAGGTVTLTSGEKATVAQFNALKTVLGADLAQTDIADSASAVANLLIAGPAATAGTGTKTLTSDVAVDAAQAAALVSGNIAGTSALKITDTADALLALGDAFTAASFTVSGGAVDISTAKSLVDIHEAKAVFSVATTAERFTKAYDSDAITSGAQPDTVAKAALAQATSLTVDGVTVTLGSKNAALIVGNQSTYNNQIVGSVAEINALSASLKTAAGFVIVDTVENITNPANTALLAASAGYVVKDSAASLAAASASVLNSTQKALGVEVSGTATVEQITTIKANSDVDTYIVYSLSDSAANLAPSGTANSNLSGAVGVTVTGDPTTAAVANAILTANPKAIVSALDSATSNLLNTGVITAANLAKLASITADSSAGTPGIQGISVANAAALISGKGANATLTFNINDDASLVAGAAAETLAAAGTISIKDTSVASAADAKILAGLTLATSYTVTDAAAGLTDSTIVSLSDLAKAGTVKILSGTATVEQAAALTGLANFERGTTGADLGKYVVSISDTALNLAKSGTVDLLNGLTAASTVAVSNYTDVLTAAEAKALADLDAASTKLATTAASVKVEDSSTALLTPGFATTLAEVGSISVTDVVSVSTLNQIRAVGGTANSEVYTYKLQDTVGALIAAGSATVDGATSVTVSGSVSVDDMTIIESRAGASSTVVTTTSYATVSDTSSDLFGGNGSTLNTTVGSKAVVIDLNGSASIDQVKSLLADSNFDKSYSVADTAANIIAAINQDSSLTVLQNGGTVGLSTGEFASAAQAGMINANLTNEAALAIKDSAANLNLSSNASTVAVAGSVTVDAGSVGNDGLTAGITTAKVTYEYASLAEINGTGSGNAVEIINGKAGDVINLSGILDWDTVTSGDQGTLIKDSGGTFDDGEYQTERGFYSSADGTFTVSATGTDTRLLIGTDATDGADEQILILGVTALTPDLVTDVNSFTFG